MIAAELRGGNKPSLNEALGWIGSRVDDIYGTNVGRLEDVWIDPGTGVPRWLLVKEGRFGGRTTLIPFEDATAGAGHVWVPYEREVVRVAPEIEPGAPLTHQVEAALRSHYATHAPAAISHRGQQPSPAPGGRQPGSAMGTAAVHLSGRPEPGPPGAFEFHPAADDVQGPPHAPPPQVQPVQQRPVPQPQRHVLREQSRPDADYPAPQPQPQRHAAGFPPVQLPARPAPPIAAPPPSRQRPAQGSQPWPVQPPPEPEGWWSQPPAAPEQAPAPAPHPTQPGFPFQQGPGWQTPPPQPPPAPTGWAPPAPQQSSIDALRDLAASPDVHYVEIELSGELSIRGELRSVRVVPRGPAQGRRG